MINYFKAILTTIAGLIGVILISVLAVLLTLFGYVFFFIALFIGTIVFLKLLFDAINE